MAWWPFGKKSSMTGMSPEVERIFERVCRLLDDEAAQNKAMQKQFRELALSQPCDHVPNGFGEFGRNLLNPVPVNGPIGELLYLTHLETADGSPIAFHRLGAFDDVDIFETVSYNVEQWDLLYLSMYYSRKSQAVPSGYRMTADQARRSLIRGTTAKIDNFPEGIFHAVIECTKRMLGVPIADSRLKLLEKHGDVARPEGHLNALRQLKFTSQLSF